MSTIVVPDRFDAHEVPAFQTRMQTATGDVVIDLGHVRFLDGAALRALVKSRADALLAGREVSVSALSTTALVTLELSGLAEALPVTPELAEVA